MTPEQFKAFVAKTKAANLSWGCWSFLYKKVNGKKQTLPVGFRVFIPNGSYQAGALKVNGKMRHGYGIFGENTIYSVAAFWLHSQRPLPADLSTLVSSLDWYGNFDYDEKKVARDTFHFRLAAFGEQIPQKEWEKYRKPKRPTGVQIEKMQVPCNLIAATCRAYSFKIDRLKWTDQHYGQPETRNRTEYRLYELVKSPNVSDEFVLEDSCPGSKWGIFQQSGPGISRGFGSTLSGYYERWINGPFLLKRSSSDGNTVADQLKPFVKTP